ncbi:hypothetical protein [uncultured Clostridium sp.]|uniref:hypothetical protein n=1 Tax=uncultured Clostridium sp. TaxID=59620 RepID=UPI0028E965BA|nr:hypothetical protein [uncultured Clostridium sp.]
MLSKDLLENLYFKQGKTQGEIAKIFNVSQSHISAQFVNLGIKSRRVWTKEDLQYLEEKFGTLSVKTIAKHTGKTEDAVIIKAKRTGLGGINKASELLNLREISRALNADIKTIRIWINKHGLKAIRKVLSKERAYWRINIKDFWKWAETHQDLIKWSKFEKNILGKEPSWVDKARKEHLLKPSRQAEKWTAKEDKILEMYWTAGKETKEIGVILNRSPQAIVRRAKRRELSRRKIELPWQPIEDEILIDMKLKGLFDREIADELGRGVGSVTWRRRKLIKEGRLVLDNEKATKDLAKVS